MSTSEKNIAPTAALVAFYRSFTDIPFAREIAKAIDAQEISHNVIGTDAIIFAKCVVAFEARFKSVNAALEKFPGIKNYFEIPAGFSSRGLTMTSDQSISFLESDLPDVLESKKLCVSRIRSTKAQNLSKLLFYPADILNVSALFEAVALLPKGEIAIITEGLLSYLPKEDMTSAAMNIRSLLALRGGIWIITDLTRLFDKNDPAAAKLREQISSLTGVSPISGCFESVEKAKKFFSSMGFEILEFRRSEVFNRLSSTFQSRLSKGQIMELLEDQATLILQIA